MQAEAGAGLRPILARGSRLLLLGAALTLGVTAIVVPGCTGGSAGRRREEIPSCRCGSIDTCDANHCQEKEQVCRCRRP